MDYVVFGTGYGATLMLLGWALRTFGPVLRYRQDTDAPLGGDMLMARLSWRRFASALGAVVATSGIALILITFVIIFVNPGDLVGSRIAWACFVLILLAVAAWMWVYVGRFGIYGILPERQEPAEVFRTHAPARDIAPSTVEATAAPVPVVGVVPEAYEDPEEDGPWLEDDEYADEQESRYAKYQLHHPDQMDETAAYDDITGPEVEPVVDRDEDVQPQVAESGEEILAQETVEEPQDVEDVATDEEPVVVSDELIDTLDEVPESIPAEHADIEPDIEEAETEIAEEPEVSDEDSGYDDQSRPLSDTPEGRAEALRRIQAWQPAESDEEEGS